MVHHMLVERRLRKAPVATEVEEAKGVGEVVGTVMVPLYTPFKSI